MAKNKHPKHWTDQQKQLWQEGMGDRLRSEVKRLYGRHKEKVFAEDINLSHGSLSDILNGKSTPSAMTLLKIMMGPKKIDIRYILTGERYEGS